MFLFYRFVKSGKPCPFCDTDLNCVWNQTCSDSETCMVRAVLEQGFKFSVHCIMVISSVSFFKVTYLAITVEVYSFL